MLPVFRALPRLSFCVLFLIFSCQSHQPKSPRPEPPPPKELSKKASLPKTFLDYPSPSCRSQFFAKTDFQGQAVPFCPGTKGLYMLPRNYPATSLIVGFTADKESVNFISFLVERIRKEQRKISVNILIPRLELELAYELLKKYLLPPYHDFVNIIPTPSDETLWAQDYFDVAISMETGRAAIFDLPYNGREGEYIPAALALACHMNLVAQAPRSELYETPGNGDYGGNIEAFPGNLVLVGDNMTEATLKTLQSHLPHRFVRVEVSWLETGHVDEIFTVLPHYKSNSACNFSLAYASPALASKLLANHSFIPEKNFLSPLPSEQDGEHVLRLREELHKCFSLFSKTGSNGGPGKRVPTICREFQKANQIYENIIQRNLKRVVTEIKQATRCETFPLIAFPQFFVPESFHGHYGQEQDFAFAFNPNAINNIDLGETLILPSQPFPPFAKAIAESVRSTGLKAVFIDAGYFHYGAGGLHCATNIIRSCRPQSARD